MTTARRKQIRLDITPYYHCTTRCVRRAYLCGYDALSKRNFDHRKQWVEDHLLFLAEIFCIEIAGYAVMSNHYHVVLRVDRQQAARLSDDEVVQRWRRLFKGPPLIQRYLDGRKLRASERVQVAALIAQWRDNLSNISRFMAHINETIARKSNREDDCTGKFWEGRFNSQAIVGKEALLQTLCYVDLNPVRAKVVVTPENAKHTSINRRLKVKKNGLMPFKPKKTPKPRLKAYLPFTLKQYLELLDWTGRQVRNGKRGAIPQNVRSILERIGFSQSRWIKSMSRQKPWTQRVLGSSQDIQKFCDAIGQKWVWQIAENQ